MENKVNARVIVDGERRRRFYGEKRVCVSVALGKNDDPSLSLLLMKDGRFELMLFEKNGGSHEVAKGTMDGDYPVVVVNKDF